MESVEPGSHWQRWHQGYEDPASPLSARLRLVQAALRDALDRAPPGPVRLVSMCAGQGRDVIDVLATHPRQGDVEALLVELDPGLVAFARARAAAAGLGLRIVEGDASLVSTYTGSGVLPADVVLACGIFGNISDDDIAAFVGALPSFCAAGAQVIWTRHRRPPDLTPAIRAWFAGAGFEEESFEGPPAPYVLSVGRHRLAVPPPSGARLDPTRRLFRFVGDGTRPA